jgi:predicted dehydrogenase
MGSNHARVFRDIENGVSLVAVADQNPQVAARVGARFRVPYYTDYIRLVEDCQPDLVSLAVPTSLHHQVGSELIRRGIHVLVEKPIAKSIEEGESLTRLAEEQGVVLAVGHIERFNPAIVALRERLDQNQAGRIFKLQAQRLSPYPVRISDAGVVIDLASHDIDLFRYLLQDEIERIYGETLSAIDSDREDMLVGVMRFQNGAVGVLDVNWMTPVKVRKLTVTASLGMFQCDLLSQELYFSENREANGQWDMLSTLRGVSQGDTRGYHIQRYEPLAAEIKDFVQAVCDGQPPKVTPRDALQTLRTALDFVESGKEKLIRVYALAGEEVRV